MTVDRLRYRLSKKRAHGTKETESSIGITSLRSVPDNEANGDFINGRPLGLIKWSFDDLVVEEILPETVKKSTSSPKDHAIQEPSNGYLLRVVSEGVPDSVLQRALRRNSNSLNGMRVHYLTPIDFLSSSSRYIWIRNSSQTDPKSDFQLSKVKTPCGDAHIVESIPIFIPSGSEPFEPVAFPSSYLPDVRYSIVVRNVSGTLANLLPRLNSLQQRGFLNFGHMARHGVSSYRSYQNAKRLLERDYPNFLMGYLRLLTEGSIPVQKELAFIDSVLRETNRGSSEWLSVMRGLEIALKEEKEFLRQPQTGLYYPHHELLTDFMTRASDLSTKRYDSAQIIRECVSRHFLQETLRSASDVFFNSMASIRWSLHGDNVVPGDLVIVDSTERGDIFEGSADHINGTITSDIHQEWVSLNEESMISNLYPKIKCVQSLEEAKKYTIEDVVLPLYGRSTKGGNDFSDFTLPSNRFADIFRTLAQELEVEGLPHLKAAPLASYRRLVVRPKDFSFYVFDKQRGWDWESTPESFSDSTDTHKASIKQSLYEDGEGIVRQSSPLYNLTGKRMIARNGIRNRAKRPYFLKPVRQSGMTCIIQMTLPRGSCITSALREVFQFTTIDPSALLQLLRR